MHGTIMLLFFATPIVFAFGNYVVPIQIGAPDVSFPRLNSFAYWLYLFGGTMATAGFLTPGGAADFGWTAYTPLSTSEHAPGVGANMWVVGLAISGLGTILGAVNLITTILTLRAPGMTMFRMPIFTWNMLVTSLLVILVFPLLAAALFALAADRLLGAHVYSPETGGPMLWQHLFWFFGHPEVYIIALPFFGIISEIIPVFSRKPIFGYKGLVAATIAIAGLSMSVWAHHMFATGQVLLPFFSFLSYLIAVPTGMKFFNWIGTMWRGQLSFESPMLFSLGFLVTFLFGGLTGVLLAAPPLDFHLHDSYFVVAHFHYVLFGTIVFAVFAGIYFWFPKMFGRMLDERLAKIHFWLTMIGFHTTFLIQHWLGSEGMPRRYADYLPEDGFTTLNMISTIGAFITGISTLPFIYNCWKSYKAGPVVEVDDPGVTATRSNGRPARRRRCVTSTGCRGSARSGRPSTTSSPSWLPDRPWLVRPRRFQAADQRVRRRRQLHRGRRQRHRPSLTHRVARRAPIPAPGSAPVSYFPVLGPRASRGDSTARPLPGCRGWCSAPGPRPHPHHYRRAGCRFL